MTALLLLAQLSGPVDCSLLNAQQRQGLNCLPAPAPAPDPTPTPEPQPLNGINPDGFAVGRVYKREATGTMIYIAGLTTTAEGHLAHAVQCLTVSTEDHCYFVGQGLFYLASYGLGDWRAVAPYEYPVGFPPARQMRSRMRQP